MSAENVSSRRRKENTYGNKEREKKATQNLASLSKWMAPQALGGRTKR